MNKKKIFLYSLLTLVLSGLLYLYIWEKPKWEAFWKKRIENIVNRQVDEVGLEIGQLRFSILPLQVEFYDAKLTLKKELKSYAKPFTVGKIAVAPSLLDILIGKVWIHSVSIDGATIDAHLEEPENSDPDSKLDFHISNYLKRFPVSQLSVQNVALQVNIGKKYAISTESLYVKAYNEKSSLILTVKDPNLGIRTMEKGETLHLISDFQLMLTDDTFSISKVKIIKDTSFFVASGNLIYNDSLENIRELNIKTRVNSNFEDLHQWSNVVFKNNHLDSIKGLLKADIELDKKSRSKDIQTSVKGVLDQLKVGKVKLGKIEIAANAPTKEQINIEKITAQLPGDSVVVLSDSKVHLGKIIDIKSDIEIQKAQLQTFLRDSGIADIPVWLQVNGQLKCSGQYADSLKVVCPGAISAKNLKIQNGGRSKTIVAAKSIDISGSMTITEKAITYDAKAKMNKTFGESIGSIDFTKGFDIQYKSDHLDFAEVGKIGELEFLGEAKTVGSTKGDSDAATFEMYIESSNLEFEKYFFGDLKTNLSYKSGSLFLKKIEANLESTRFNGELEVNLLKENIIGDIQLPFFRMTDVQQAVLKKVDLQDRFKGSGSGRIRLDTPFEVSRMNFNLDARLFKGEAFGEDYNEATLKAEAVDGIIIAQEVKLEKEKTQFLLKGTLDTELESKLSFIVNNGFLQLSSQLKEYALPLAGEFNAKGEISGNLAAPIIKTEAKIQGLIFNKKKYGQALFSYDNSNKQTHLQFNIPDQLDLLILLPESNFESIFIDTNASKFDIAPLIGYAVSEEATRSYFIETSGELSGTFNTKEFWNSEFSSTIKSVTFDYKSNKMETTIPTNIELKNGKLFLNEISFIGNKQHIKITQPYTEKYRTKFVVNSRLNIAFFKLFAPFIEKIDGYSELRLELSLNNKDVKLVGSSYTTESFLKFPGFPHALENMTADVIFNQNKVSINSFSGDLAGGKFLGNGEVKFTGPSDFDIFIKSNLENVTIQFPEGFKTSGNGEISLSGSKPPFLLAGHYEVQEGLIDSDFGGSGPSSSTDLLEELLKEEVSSPLTLNIDIKTLSPLEVRNSFVEAYVIGDITVFDRINAPRIKGEGNFDKNAVIRIKDQEFEVTSSNFLFEGQNPINPKLSLRAQTRVNNNYDIEMFLQGRANKPIITWTSQPPLPETQIIAMLALGTLPDQFDQNSSTELNSSNGQGFEVGTSFLGNNPLGRELKERYDVDVQFSSSFDDQTGAAAPKFTMRKKLSKKFQISGSATTGNTNQMEGRATYELNNDLSAVFRVKNRPDDTNSTTNSTTPTTQANPFGLDIEYRMEFD